MFPEALLLHYMDDLDSKMESMRAHLERDADSPNPWAGYNPSLGRNLLNTAKFLAAPVACGDEAADPNAPKPDFEPAEPVPAAVLAGKKF
jgi:3'-5' exoribonuclease